MALSILQALKPFVPAPILAVKKQLYYWLIDDQRTVGLDIFRWTPRRNMSYAQRSEYVRKMQAIHTDVGCAHTHDEILTIIREVLTSTAPAEACVVEAGCFKGGSTAKLSLAADAVGRQLWVFDSFEGLPDVEAFEANFSRGAYCGQLEEVKANIARYGKVSHCEFVKGWFCDTMPRFHRPVAVAFVDADLVSSVADCMRALYPLLVPGGVIFSHDGHLKPVVEKVLRNEQFWREVGGVPPRFERRGYKLVAMRKPLHAPPLEVSTSSSTA